MAKDTEGDEVSWLSFEIIQELFLPILFLNLQDRGTKRKEREPDIEQPGTKSDLFQWFMFLWRTCPEHRPKQILAKRLSEFSSDAKNRGTAWCPLKSPLTGRCDYGSWISRVLALFEIPRCWLMALNIPMASKGLTNESGLMWILPGLNQSVWRRCWSGWKKLWRQTDGTWNSFESCAGHSLLLNGPLM